MKQFLKALFKRFGLHQFILRTLLWFRLCFVKTYIVSYPKSGRTWVRFFVSVYLSERYHIPLRLDWYYFFLPRAIKRFHFTHLDFKAADVREVEKTLFKMKGKRVLFLVRDPRDTIVSFYFYRKHRQGYEGFQNYTIGEYIRDEEYGLKQIVDYMNVVYTHQQLFEDIKIIRYEDLRDPEKGRALFKEILTFIGQADIDSKAFDVAMEKSEFSTMQKMEKSNEIDDERLKAKSSTDDNALTVRRGKVGGYIDYFLPEDREYAESELRHLNEHFGYS
jgi:hypothetical protein